MAKRELTPLQKAFLEALLGEARGDFALAKKLAGYAPTVSTTEIIRSLKDEIREAAVDAISMASVEASFKLRDVMTNPAANGASNALKAAQQILDRVGVKPDETVKIPEGGLFIMPAKNAKALGVVEDKGEDDAEE